MPVYSRSKLAFTHGEGMYLYTKDKTSYLDFAAGVAVNSFGHSHPTLIKALKKQADKLWHVSNLYEIPELATLAKRLVENTFADTVFFTNSGAEANETVIKMMRKYFDTVGFPNKYRIITFSGSFHGRTLATASASNRDKCIAGFEPAVDGFDHVPFGDISAVRNTITQDTAGILIEPIQGEGGVIPAEKEFLQDLRDLADKHDILLAYDEIQCGVGRTGKLYAYEHYGVVPDILATAKGIGNGFPFGACLATEKAALGMTAGTHGSTYGGNPLAMAVGNAVLDLVLEKDFLPSVKEKADLLQKKLKDLHKKHKHVIDTTRGVGLMCGIKLNHKLEAGKIVEQLRQEKLLTVPAGENTIRLLPPLIVQTKHINEAISILDTVFKTLN